MSFIGGDDIDLMLDTAQQSSYKAVPPPTSSHNYNNDYKPDKNDKHNNMDDDIHYHRNYHSNNNNNANNNNNNNNANNSNNNYSHNNNTNENGINKNKYTENENNDNDNHNKNNNSRHRHRSRSPYYNHRRERESMKDRYYNDRREDERSRREQQDIERDQRTIFVCQIHPKCDERDIFEFFSNVGKVIDIQLIRDNRTFKSKGLCYVEFEDKSSVAHALSLSGQSLGGFPVSVQLTQAERNRAAQAAAQSSQQQLRPMKLYIAHIHAKVTEDDIRPVFMAFGEVLSLEIKKDHRGKSKGYGFVEFRREIDAIAAMKKLDGLEILAQKISVTVVDTSQDTSRVIRDTPSTTSSGNNTTSNNNTTSTSNTNSTGFATHSERLEEESGNGGLFLGLTSKLELMKKLGGGAMADTANEALKQQTNLLNRQQQQIQQQIQYHNLSTTGGVNNVNNTNNANISNNNNAMPQQTMSRCVLLRNMFDPSTEEDPDFDLEIREDVMDEVKKFGELLHIYVDKTSRDGLVYLKFKNVEHATRTINNLNGRWFAKKSNKS